MGVYQISDLVLTNAQLNRAFDPNVLEYTITLTDINVKTIQLDFKPEIVGDIGSLIVVDVYSVDEGHTIHPAVNVPSGSYMSSQTTLPLITLDKDKTYQIYIGPYPYSNPDEKTLYTLKFLYTTTDKFPIRETELPPGFYGGSYVPNYRYLNRLFSTGNNEWDFENNYENLKKIDEATVDKLNSIVNQYTQLGKLDAIVEAFIHYSGFVNTNWYMDGDYRYYLPIIEVSTQRPTHMRNNYVPKNNKLFSYPYSCLRINGYGSQNDLKWELFPKDVHFGIVSKFFAGEAIEMHPINYNGLLDNYDEGATGQPLPVFPYTKDEYLNGYKATQNVRTAAVNALEQTYKFNQLNSHVQGALGAISSGLSGAATGSQLGKTGATGSIVGGAVNAGKSLIGTGFELAGNRIQYNQGLRSYQAELADVVNKPSSVANQNASPSIPQAMKDAVVPFLQLCSIREAFAKKIDEYFTRYGYRVNKAKTPDIYSRPSYNFIKTSKVELEGTVNKDVEEQIKAIFNHGITFWHTTNVNDYTQANPAPITNNPRYCGILEEQ